MGIGGDLSPNSSPQSPFFFPHHVFVDCIYRHWQSLGKDKRVKDYYGNLGDADEDDGPFKASLSDPLRMHGLDVDVTVADVMNAQGDILCYKVCLRDLNRITPFSRLHIFFLLCSARHRIYSTS
jgi:hypothetical protein